MQLSKGPRNQLTYLVLEWLHQEFPHWTQTICYYDTGYLDGRDEIMFYGCTLLLVSEDTVIRSGLYYHNGIRFKAADPDLFKKLRPLTFAAMRGIISFRPESLRRFYAQRESQS